ARLHIFNKHLDEMLVGAVGEIRFRPYSGADLETLPLIVRNIEPSGDISNVGCQYVPKSALDHRLWAAALSPIAASKRIISAEPAILADTATAVSPSMIEIACCSAMTTMTRNSASRNGSTSTAIAYWWKSALDDGPPGL
ncbi:hypothetical protein ACCS96_13375, partial [Rhizobium ruizarguesonis]